MDWRILAASIYVLGAHSPAWAQGASPVDYDGDGRIGIEEFRNHAARQATLADKNGNGALDSDEYSLTNAERAGMDTNKDGAIQVSEFQQSLSAAFAELDRNGDGQLDTAERKSR